MIPGVTKRHRTQQQAREGERATVKRRKKLASILVVGCMAALWISSIAVIFFDHFTA